MLLLPHSNRISTQKNTENEQAATNQISDSHRIRFDPRRVGVVHGGELEVLHRRLAVAFLPTPSFCLW